MIKCSLQNLAIIAADCTEISGSVIF